MYDGAIISLKDLIETINEYNDDITIIELKQVLKKQIITNEKMKELLAPL